MARRRRLPADYSELTAEARGYRVMAYYARMLGAKELDNFIAKAKEIEAALPPHIRAELDASLERDLPSN